MATEEYGENAPYHDVRAGFWKHHYEIAQTYADYLASSKPEHAAKWTGMAEKLPALTSEQRERVHGVSRPLHVLAYSGVWCGDCVRQGPMIERIAQAGATIDVRWIDREASRDLTEELRLAGAERVPVFVFLSEDFFEMGRFGDRSLTAYRGKAERELGPSCDTGLVAPPPDQIAAEIEEWIAVTERMLLMLRLSPFYRQKYRD